MRARWVLRRDRQGVVHWVRDDTIGMPPEVALAADGPPKRWCVAHRGVEKPSYDGYDLPKKTCNGPTCLWCVEAEVR